MGNHLVGFRFEGENQDNKQVVMSFKTFYFKNGSGKQSITCKVDTCDGPCDQGKFACFSQLVLFGHKQT